ncbi:hypothetical protein SAY86_008643 [Trapa natans]|uniref:GDSL esterase/lipase n=1 Tax=Trapa natans TaxID=22666 RepID=A0AAN7QES2_TRANT|nr:hypothetical protein SAY86_008643 [Trapa natans]
MVPCNKYAILFLQAAVMVAVLCAVPSHGKIDGQISSSLNLAGSFDTVFAFGDSDTDNGNCRLIGGFRNFVGGWLNTLKGAMALQSGGGFGGSVGGAVSAPGGSAAGGSDGGSKQVTVSGNGLINGKLIIEHLCDALGIPSIQPYQNHAANFSSGANFAVAGSTTLPGSFFLHNNLLSLMWKTVPETFDTQLQWFNNFIQNFKNKGAGGKGGKPNMDNTLFWLGGVGKSDFARIHRVSASSEWLTQQAIDHITKFIQGIVSQGAKYIVVQGLPPVGCLPLDLATSSVTERDQNGCAARINNAVMRHNELLQQTIGSLQKSFPKCVFVYADIWKAYMQVLSGYHQYGFTEPFKACCGIRDGSQYNFNLKDLCGTLGTTVCSEANKHMVWDGIHFTAAMHTVIFKLFTEGGCTHPTFEQLLKIKSAAQKVDQSVGA